MNATLRGVDPPDVQSEAEDDPFTFNNAGNLLLTGGDSVLDEARLVNAGTVNQERSIRLSFADIVNEADKTWNLGNVRFLFDAGTPTSTKLTNHGRFIKKTGTGAAEMLVRFVNEGDGEVDVETGRLNFSRGADLNGGSMVIGKDGVVGLSGLLALYRVLDDFEISGDGKLLFNSGVLAPDGGKTVTINMSAENGYQILGGDTGGDGRVVNKGKAYWRQGFIRSIVNEGDMLIADGSKILSGVLTNRGTINYKGTTLSFNNNGILNNHKDFNINAVGAALTLGVTGDQSDQSRINNIGGDAVLRKTGPGVADIDMPVNQLSGGSKIIVKEGELRLDGGSSHFAGSFIFIEKTSGDDASKPRLRLNGLNTIKGETYVNGDGELAITSDGAELRADGGPIAITLNPPGGVVFSRGVLNGKTHPIDITADFRWSGGTIKGGNAGVTPDVHYRGGGAGMRIDAGLSPRASVEGVLKTDGIVIQTGTFFLDSGTVEVNRSLWILRSGDIKKEGHLGSFNHGGGTLVKPVGTETRDSTIEARYSMKGPAAIEVQGARLTLTGGGSFEFSPTINVSPEATMVLASRGSEEEIYRASSLKISGSEKAAFAVESGAALNVVVRVESNVSAAAISPGDSSAGDIGGFILEGGVILGVGQFINQNDFRWRGGTISFAGSSTGGDAAFRNEGDLDIEVAPILAGKLVNTHEVHQFANLQLTPAAVVDNSSEWIGRGVVSLGVTEGAGLFNNTAFLNVKDENAHMTIKTVLDNSGVVRASTPTTEGGASVIDIDGPIVGFVDGVLGQGGWEAINKGKLLFPDSIKSIGMNASVLGDQSNLPALTDLQSIAGSLELHGGLDLDLFGSFRIESGGVIRLNGTDAQVEAEFIDIEGEGVFDSMIPQLQQQGNSDDGGSGAQSLPVTLTNGITLRSGPLTNAGLLRPGGHRGVGFMPITGDLIQSDEGVLEIELAGLANDPTATEFDQVLVTGDVTLDGELSVGLIPGYFPKLGDRFEFLLGLSILGEFDIKRTFNGPDGLLFDVDRGAGSLTLVVKAVPEPSAAALLTIGLMMAAILRTRR